MKLVNIFLQPSNERNTNVVLCLTSGSILYHAVATGDHLAWVFPMPFTAWASSSIACDEEKKENLTLITIDNRKCWSRNIKYQLKPFRCLPVPVVKSMERLQERNYIKLLPSGITHSTTKFVNLCPITNFSSFRLLMVIFSIMSQMKPSSQVLGLATLILFFQSAKFKANPFATS